MSRSGWRLAVAAIAGTLPIAAGSAPCSAQERRDAVARITFNTKLPKEGACVGVHYKILVSPLNRFNELIPAEGRMTGAKFGSRPPQDAVEKKGDFWLVFVYQAFRWQRGAKERITFSVRGFDPARRTVTRKLRFRVRHCLGGRWRDGKRTLEVEHKGNSVTAWLVAGEICERTGRMLIFSGKLKGDRLKVKNLVTCEPRICVEGGRQRKIFRVRWKARVSPDGRSISGKWKQIRYDTRRRGGQTICRKTGEIRWLPLTVSRQR